MIYEWLVDKLEAVEALGEKVYPVAVCVDDVEPPLAIYKTLNTDYVRDISGDVHHVAEVVEITLLGPDYETLHQIAQAAVEGLEAVSNLDTGTGEWLFSAMCDQAEPEGFDTTMGIMSKTIRVTLRYCSMGTEG